MLRLRPLRGFTRLTAEPQWIKFFAMNATRTSADRQLLKQLLKLGRWTSQNEVIRSALFLLKVEFEHERLRELTPYSQAALRRASRKASREDIAADRRLAKASARAGQKSKRETVGRFHMAFPSR